MKPVIAASVLVLLLLGSFFAGLAGSLWAPGWLSPQSPLDTSPHLASEQSLRSPAASAEETRRIRKDLEIANARVTETELRLLGLQKSIADLAISLEKLAKEIEELAKEKRKTGSPMDMAGLSGADRRDESETPTVDGEEGDESLSKTREDESVNSWFVHLGTFETEAQALAIASEAALLLGTRPQVFATNGPLWSVRLCQLDTQVSAQEAVNAMRRARISEGSWIGRGCSPR